MAEVEQKAMIGVDELLRDKAELLVEASQADNNEAVLFEQKVLTEEHSGEYISIYSGRALNGEELFHFSAKEDINTVLVAGPYASGKTTLIVMLYRLFLEGYNKKLCFAGSNTIEGFCERSANLLYQSGQAEPFVARTSRVAEDCYLHLAISVEGIKHNIFLADVSGEKFSDSSEIERIAEDFSDSENVIIIVDGEKLCDPYEKKGVIFDTDLLLRRLLNKKIISKRTKLQIVFTKKDKIDDCKQKEEIVSFLREKEQMFIRKFETYAYSIKCIYLSALSDELEECEKLEQILQNCLKSMTVSCDLEPQIVEHMIIRNFDKFQIRESV